MQEEQVDERDSSWEDHNPRFRVYLFDRGRGGEYAITDTWDLTGADVLEAMRWAQQRAGGDGLYALALVRDDLQPYGATERGIVWLVGMDWFDDVTGSPAGERTKARMIARRGRLVVAAEAE